MRRAMRVSVEGGETDASAAIARALTAGGCTLAAAGDPRAVRITLGEVMPRRIARGGLSLDLALCQARLDGRVLRLSRLEYALLAAIACSPRPLDRAALLRLVWGYDFDPGTNVVAVHVSRLRAKLGGGRLLCSAEGYRLAGQEEETPCVSS